MLSRRLGFTLAWSLAALVCSATSAAQGSASELTLDWSAPPECASATELHARIARRIGSTPFSPLRVRGRFENTPDGRVNVSLRTDHGERVFSAPSCEEAAEAVTVIVALAATRDSDAASSATPPPSPPPSVDVRADARPNDADTISPSPSAHDRGWFVTAGAALDSASLPHATPGGFVDVETHRGLFAFGLTGAVFAPQTRHSTEDNPASTTIMLADALAKACLDVPTFNRTIDFGACASAGVGILPGSSEAITHPRSSAGARFEAGAMGRARIGLGRVVAVRLEGGPLFDPVRPSFEIGTIGEAYRPPFVAFRGSVGLEVRIR